MVMIFSAMYASFTEHVGLPIFSSVTVQVDGMPAMDLGPRTLSHVTTWIDHKVSPAAALGTNMKFPSMPVVSSTATTCTTTVWMKSTVTTWAATMRMKSTAAVVLPPVTVCLIASVP
ncbi:hypothetical protein RHSIM_Rhsim05G0044200 [Rhododendron simsii]|uniref:Uncharacterized protein n=1 Tax=Rhododendron simsii TaxID=118357 RepID=A0A834LR10_RHOSS|nr:hypothetical protein RHSIM_Rhsim05G0044200 [Rhododendron simsii]